MSAATAPPMRVGARVLFMGSRYAGHPVRLWERGTVVKVAWSEMYGRLIDVEWDEPRRRRAALFPDKGDECVGWGP